MFTLNDPKYDNLTKEREQEINALYFKAIANNDLEVIKSIKEELVNRHLKLIFYVLKQYKYKVTDDNIDDLFSVGVLALTECFKNFEPDKGSIYLWAERWLKTAFTKFFDHERMIRLPSKKAYASALIEIEKNKLREKLNRDLTKEEIENIKKEEKDFDDYAKVTDSLDRELVSAFDNESYTVGSLIIAKDYDPESIIMDNDYKEIINNAICELTEIEQDVIKHRFAINDNDRLTLQQLGNKYELTGEAMRRIEATALMKLKHPSLKNDLSDLLFD